MTPLDRIMKALGGRSAVAVLCDVSGSAVGQWADNGVPGRHVLTLEAATKDTDYPVTAREILEWSALCRQKDAA